MRIAISGTHFSGKSTLIAALAKQLPNYTSVEEPYRLLEEKGYEFSNPPSLEDFEEQFAYSITSIIQSSDNTLFDRCPLDFLAYAQAVAEDSWMEEDLYIARWVQEMEEAIRLLDLIIFVPIEERDRIRVPISEDMHLRKNVDEKLQALVLSDVLEILDGLEVLEVVGPLEKRVQRVIDYLNDSNF